MCNLYKTVKEIVGSTPSISNYLQEEEKYLAHRDASGCKAPETLAQHIKLVTDYLLHLVEVHQLDAILDGLISSYLLECKVIEQFLGEEIKRQFIQCICFHDHGKVNINFQADERKMDNAYFKDEIEKGSPIGTTHSALGAFTYLSRESDYLLQQADLGDEAFIVLMRTAYCFSYLIFKHHSSRLDNDIEQTIGLMNLSINRSREELLTYLAKYLSLFNFAIDTRITQSIGSETALQACFEDTPNSTSMFALLKLGFSLLTASDYLATNEYSSGSATTDFGVFSKERIEEIYQNVSQRPYLVHQPGKVNFNAQTYRDVAGYKIQNPKELSGTNLNTLRKEMGVELLRTLRKHLDRHLFYIEAPTGGGKTNLSALATIELLRASEGKLNKVFYVFPFTTLITQTFASLKKTYGLADDELVELHSRASFAGKKGNDAQYGADKLNYIAHLFAHYPLCLLSHVSFFDILKGNQKEHNYLLHRMANSVVVIDELQSYDPKHWDKVIFFIRTYAKAFNIKFVLMSATLPKLDKLTWLSDKVEDFVYLLPDARKKYFQNPNFSQRTSFNFDYFERKDLSLEELGARLLQESETYATYDYGEAKPAGSVYTIIEFIFKQAAADFYQLMRQHNFFDEIFLLSGTILEHRRQYIINYLKNPLNRNKKILLVTTQVVEAGVDIDMDLGFKDRSLIDSDEQLAGRINRNVNKQKSVLFLFNYSKESAIYGGDARLKLTRELIDTTKYKEILETKNFDLLYDLVINEQNSWNNTDIAKNFGNYKELVWNLRFAKVNGEFKLIEQKNISCFIPLEIPIAVEGTLFFNKQELAFLKTYGVEPTWNETIDGREVFDLYINVVRNRADFMTQKIREKTLQSILSKYVISLFATPKVEAQIKLFSDLDKSEFGYYYVSRWADFYSEAGGMDTAKMYGIEETQFL